jgi:RNA polymerase sigma factor (sigma-70 family)
VAREGGEGEEQRPQAIEIDWSILMARAQDGDQIAYHRLLREITPYLRALAARRHRDRSDIEDSVQDILLTIHSIRQTYDPTRPFAPWLVAIADRRCIDRLRQQGRKLNREVSLLPEHETFADAAANGNAEKILEVRDLEQAIDQLPRAQREAVRLLKIRQLSLKEAAGESGASVDSLKISMHRALKNLRKILDRI